MKWLSIVGKALLLGTKILMGVGPMVPGLANKTEKIVDTLENVAAIIINVEAFGQVLSTPGADKLKAATPMVAQIILRSDMMAGQDINNEVLFMQGCTKVTDGMADVLNSLKDKIKTD
jgi:hypothetical protein